MPEYIEREALMKVLKFRIKGQNRIYDTANMILSLVEDYVNATPTADVVEVRRGEWSNTDWSGVAINGYMVCTQCNVMIPKCEYNRYYLSYSRYCPNCGAKMDEKGD